MNRKFLLFCISLNKRSKDKKSKDSTKSTMSQKQSPRGVPRKRCSENMQQTYRRTPMPKCDFNKVAKQSKATLLKSHFGMGVLL